MPSSTGRPTLADVAAAAGVSLKTASRALNREYGVAGATSAKVEEAADRLGYRLNHLARSLAAKQSSATVGLVIPTMADPFFAAMAAEIERVLAPRKLGLISASHGDDIGRQKTITGALVERRVDALVVVSAPGDSSYLQVDLDHGLPVVAVDRPLVGVAVDTVVIDNRGAARTAVGELIGLGHHRIAVLGFDERLWTTRERFAGYGDAMARAGLVTDPRLVRLTCGDAAEAEQVLTGMLALDEPPTAVFAIQNRSGRAAVRAMVAAGSRLPVSVFDDVADPDLLVVPPLTVVGSEPSRLGAAAAAMILDRLDGRQEPVRRTELQAIFEHPRPPGDRAAPAHASSPAAGGRPRTTSKAPFRTTRTRKQVR